MQHSDTVDVVVVGGGPAGATAATELARQGRSVILLDKAGRIKPCGGAVPPRLMQDFDIPRSLLVAEVGGARVISPSEKRVDMPIDGGYVGMVDREDFDEWLRVRAANAGATRVRGKFDRLERDDKPGVVVHFEEWREESACRIATSVRAAVVIGADGARSAVARESIPNADRIPFVFAYHEIVEAPDTTNDAYDKKRCDVYYQGRVSPDFYGWVFPHGETASVGVGSAIKGFSLRGATGTLRQASGLENARTIRREGAPIPLRTLRKWDNGRDVLLAGDAAGTVAPASGEGIFYSMTSGRLAGEAADAFLASGNVRMLATARKKFMKEHGRVFWILGIMQYFWYSSDRRRERFVKICEDPDVQRLTWQAYMNKKLVKSSPVAHARIFFKDLAHLCGFASP